MPTRPPLHRPPGARSREDDRRNYDASRASSSARGYDAEWRKARAAFLAAHPMCCEPGCDAAATEVDHIERVSDRPDLRLEPSNFRGFCKPHHSARTSRDHSWNAARG